MMLLERACDVIVERHGLKEYQRRHLVCMAKGLTYADTSDELNCTVKWCQDVSAAIAHSMNMTGRHRVMGEVVHEMDKQAEEMFGILSHPYILQVLKKLLSDSSHMSVGTSPETIENLIQRIVAVVEDETMEVAR